MDQIINNTQNTQKIEITINQNNNPTVTEEKVCSKRKNIPRNNEENNKRININPGYNEKNNTKININFSMELSGKNFFEQLALIKELSVKQPEEKKPNIEITIDNLEPLPKGVEHYKNKNGTEDDIIKLDKEDVEYDLDIEN